MIIRFINQEETSTDIKSDDSTEAFFSGIVFNKLLEDKSSELIFNSYNRFANLYLTTE